MTSSGRLHPVSRPLPHAEGNVLADAPVTRGTGLKIVSEFS